MPLTKKRLFIGSGRNRSGEEVGGAFQDAGGEDDAGAAVVKGDGEGEDAPGEGLVGEAGVKEEAAPGAVDVGLASLRDGAEDFVPIFGYGLEYVK